MPTPTRKRTTQSNTRPTTTSRSTYGGPTKRSTPLTGAGNRVSKTAPKTAPKPAPRGTGPGIGGGALGQRLAASAAAYVPTGIGGTQPPPGVVFGAHDSGSTMEQTIRNQWLNTLSLEERSRAMNQMGYWSGGVPQATPKTWTGSTPENLGEGQQWLAQNNGVYYGIFTGHGEGVAPTYSALRADSAQSEGGRRRTRADVRKSRLARAGASAPKGKSEGQKKGGSKGRRPNKGRGKGPGKGNGRGQGPGASGGPGGLPVTPTQGDSSYAEADVTTTSMLRAQGKAYAKGRAGGGSMRGDSWKAVREEALSEEAAAEGKKVTNRRKTTKKTVKNKRGNYVTRTRKGGEVVKKRVTQKKPSGRKNR